MAEKEKDQKGSGSPPAHSEKQQQDPTATDASASHKSEPPPKGKASQDPPSELTPEQRDARAAGSRAGGPVSPTLTNPVSLTDIDINVSSSQGIQIGMKVMIDSEILRVAQSWLSTPYAGTNTVPVLRGQSGTVTAKHAAGTTVMVGDAYTDYAIRSAPGTVADLPGVTPMSPTQSMGSTDKAVPVPSAVGFNTVTLPVATDLTLALPAPDMNGALLLLVGNAKGTGTVAVASTPTPTTPGGVAGSSLTVAAGTAKLLLASGGNWIYPATA